AVTAARTTPPSTLSLHDALPICCNPIQAYFQIVLPIMKPTCITVAILEAMWIWNDYLLPLLVLDSDYQTIPIAIQYLKGNGNRRSEEHTSELQSRFDLVCRLLLE